MDRVPVGLSAKAIAFTGHFDHPRDPADLQRCVDFCQQQHIDVAELRRRMTGRTPYWDALLPHWKELVTTLQREAAAGPTAPETYALMKRYLDIVASGETWTNTQTGEELYIIEATGDELAVLTGYVVEHKLPVAEFRNDHERAAAAPHPQPLTPPDPEARLGALREAEFVARSFAGEMLEKASGENTDYYSRAAWAAHQVADRLRALQATPTVN